MRDVTRDPGRVGTGRETLKTNNPLTMEGARNVRADPDWSLIRTITRAASDPRWAGGVSREHLAAITGLSAHSPALSQAIAIAVRLRRVDLADGYVIPGRPAEPAARRTAA